MILNYLVVALRNLRKHFSYSIINIAGLGLGLATCLLLAVWIRHETSFDNFHAKRETLYRVALEYSFGGQTAKTSVSPTALLPALQKNFAEVQTGVRFYNPASFNPYVVRKDQSLFEENKFYFADSTFFEVFSFHLLQGDKAHALVAPNSVVLTQSMVKKYFGNEDPIGKVIQVNNRLDYTITGVMEDVPDNSMLQFDFVASFSSIDASKETIWWSANYQTYVVLESTADLATLQAKTNDLVKNALANELTNPGDYVHYNFTSMKDIYLRSTVGEPELVGSIDYVYIFSAIAILILVIACINYINLATARAADRAKEVGIRKVVGAHRKQLIVQFIGESVVITAVAFAVATFLSTLTLPLFNELTGKHFSPDSILNPTVILTSIFILFLIAVLAGVYPALVITGFKPVNILKGNFRTSGKGVWLRQSLVVFQFCISIVLIIGTVVILKQVDYIQTKKLGFEKENILILPLDRKTREVYSQLKTEFIRSGKVTSVGRAAEAPVRIKGGYSINFPGSDDRGMLTTAMPIDEGFIQTMDMEIVAGRNMTENDFEILKRDTVYAFVLNETALKALSIDVEKAPGMAIVMNNRRGHIVGVVKDFHFDSMHERIAPLVLFSDKLEFNYIFLKLAAGNVADELKEIKSICANLIPHRPFEYHFLNERFDALYRGEQRMGAVCSVFATLAIIIACLGLLGLVAFAAAQKTKEIGIRKVLGATAANIMVLITRDFTRLIVLSIAIGIPLSWYVMEKFWLVNFEYRTTIGIWPFVSAAVGCVGIAFATASFQAIKAAYLNPANTLRNE